MPRNTVEFWCFILPLVRVSISVQVYLPKVYKIIIVPKNMKNSKVFSKYGEIVLPPFIFMVESIINVKKDNTILSTYGLLKINIFWVNATLLISFSLLLASIQTDSNCEKEEHHFSVLQIYLKITLKIEVIVKK